MKLVPGKRAYKDGKDKCTIPSATKDYLLYQMKDLKNQRKGDHYSCNLDDWVDSINLVIDEITP